MNILLPISYLVASILFVVGIKMLNKTKTARRGNFLSALGMFIAILAAVSQVKSITYVDILIGFLIGSAIGLIIAFKVKMTKIAQNEIISTAAVKGDTIGLSMYMLK